MECADDDADDEDFFVIGAYDPEAPNDRWKCVNCKTPNTPYIRYCAACYKVTISQIFFNNDGDTKCLTFPNFFKTP